MPCLNEAETIEICVRKALEFIDRENIRAEVLIADNGSTDGSIEIAERLGARVVNVEQKGYGAALAGGIESARGTYVIMGDADDSYDFSKLELFVQELRTGNDLVMGNRFRGGISEGAMPFLHRYLGNPVLSFIGRLFFNIRTGDFHCGMRGFRRDAILDLKLHTSGMEFASEMVVRSAMGRLKITEVPTTLKPDGRSRPPHLRTWRDGWRHLKFLLMHNPRWLFVYPGLVFTLLGGITALILMFGPVQIAGSVALGTNTFIASCLITIVGTQLLTFGALARMIATTSGLLPVGEPSKILKSWATTDNIALFAFWLLLFGLLLFGIAFGQWARLGFGDISNPLTTRLTVAGFSLMAISIQSAFAAFLFGIIEIPTRKK
ncbi:glycosyltransferase family 2 protein [Rhodobacteraceae bacterium B1Z28]|uniref:Glycosyltransferase family 2 protein n=2 Tax=Ruegeria haliotis TaxID=2747601 RepID=A0ABX2PNP1_9RHOB|nr:glycosyltransferase family 2 protein [Ruegeria haliotis]